MNGSAVRTFSEYEVRVARGGKLLGRVRPTPK